MATTNHQAPSKGAEHDAVACENGDLRWLVGRLVEFAPDDVLLPPRLAVLAGECMEAYDPGRFTVATPVGDIKMPALTVESSPRCETCDDKGMVPDPQCTLTGSLRCESPCSGCTEHGDWSMCRHAAVPS